MLDTLWDSGISLLNTCLRDTLEKAKRSLYYWRNVLFGELPLDSCLSLPTRGNREQLLVKEVGQFREPSRNWHVSSWIWGTQRLLLTHTWKVLKAERKRLCSGAEKQVCRRQQEENCEFSEAQIDTQAQRSWLYAALKSTQSMGIACSGWVDLSRQSL